MLPDALHALRLAQCSPSIAVYVSAPPTARHIPLASVMGIEPISRWVWRPDRPPGRTPYDSFLTGESTKTQGRTDALCWPGASGSRGARPEPSFVSVITSLPRKQPTLLGSTCVATDTVRTSYLSSALVHFALLGGGVASLNGFSCAAIRSCGPVGEKAHEVFTSFPPHLEAKRSGNYFK